MMKRIGMIACAAGCWGAVIYAGAMIDVKAAALIALAMILTALFTALATDAEEPDAEEPDAEYDFDAKATVCGREVRIESADVESVCILAAACKKIIDSEGYDWDAMNACFKPRIVKCEDTDND